MAVYSEADRHSLHVDAADEAVLIGPPKPAQSYLSIEALLDAARKTGAEAIHPGYGFLSENADFARACEQAGITFIGPTSEQLIAFGLKHTARELAAGNGVPMLHGTGLLKSEQEAVDAAATVGYPVMLKSTAGGGGIGMRVCHSAEEVRQAFAAVQRLSATNFGDGGIFVERFVTAARHIEVQIFGDGQGSVVALGERDCSAQRRNQKVIEETPAPGLSYETRTRLLDSAVRLGRAVKYRSAGTVEFIYDNNTAEFFFLEVNTRLQVEHGVTEEVTGIDLVEWMIRVAGGETFDLVAPKPQGSSIQVRIYAEDPAKNFQPVSGRISHIAWPQETRVETWVQSGDEITPYYDPMVAKLIVRGSDRATALSRLRIALDNCEIAGIETNLSYLRAVCSDPAFDAGGITTGFLGSFTWTRSAIDVLEPGTQTTIQDYPGRLGFWNVGVPPSGPMDYLSFRLVNQLVGNNENAPGLEITLTGPTLRFAADTWIALGGADFEAKLDGVSVARWKAVKVSANSVLRMTAVRGPGARAYLAVRGGIEAPSYLGSRSTFILGGFGGEAGRVLRTGDVVYFGNRSGEPPPASFDPPEYGHEWAIAVLYGPHGAPDFFTSADIEMFFSTAWKVHYNSDRTGVRLIGPKPKWARKDGGEAGLHPSNIHDNAYAVGTIDFTGDMPVILGPDGPSLGGFVCPATIVHGDLWKIGQLKPGDTVRFRPASYQQALEYDSEIDRYVSTVSGGPPQLPQEGGSEDAVLRKMPGLVCRADGDRYLLVEYGENVLDLNLRLRVHALQQQLEALQLSGIVDITPGIRSLHVHFDRRLDREDLLTALQECERCIPSLDAITIPSRTVHLPLCWDDPATQVAIQKYTQSVRPDAPWCPSNIEFIRRINGLQSIDDVHRIVFAASYLVLGLGDVYLGAPVATPLDPRHRLVTTKYNPARTWTPENAVGIGGAYLCVYGMEGPGGYQFVGRTVQMWNTFRTTPEFEPGKPWLLRFFDQIRFYPVTASELLEMRDAFPRGRFRLRIEEQEFRIGEYHAFLEANRKESARFKEMQQSAFDAERERWAANGQAAYIEPPESVAPERHDALPEGCQPVHSPVTANVWKVVVEPGQRVDAGQHLLVLEAMKMEIAVTSPTSGVIEQINCAPGIMVSAGQRLATLRLEATC